MRLLTITCWLAVAGAAAAQSDSHIPIQNWGGGRHDPTAMAQQLRERLKQRPRPPAAPNGMDPELLRKLEEMVRQDPEKWQKFVENQMAGNSDLRRAIERGALDNLTIRNQLLDRSNGASGLLIRVSAA